MGNTQVFVQEKFVRIVSLNPEQYIQLDLARIAISSLLFFLVTYYGNAFVEFLIHFKFLIVSKRLIIKKCICVIAIPFNNFWSLSIFSLSGDIQK